MWQVKRGKEREFGVGRKLEEGRPSGLVCLAWR